jgi:hypothetical protein
MCDCTVLLLQAGRAYNQIDRDGEDEEERLVQHPSSTDAHAEPSGGHGEHGGHFDFGEVRRGAAYFLVIKAGFIQRMGRALCC